MMNVGKGVLTLGTGAIVSQLWVLCTLPILTRLYTPEAFGGFAIFLAAHVLLAVFAGLRYESAAVIPFSNRTAAACSVIVVLASLVVTGLLFSGYVLFEFVFHSTPGSGQINGALFALGVGATSGAFHRIATAWGTRLRNFRLLAAGQISLSTTTVLFQIALAPTDIDPALALTWGFVAALGITALWMCWSLRVHFAKAASVYGLRVRTIAALRKYRRFPLYMAPYGVVSALRDRIVFFIFGWLSSVSTVGSLSLAMRLGTAPNSLVYAAINPVVFSYASRADRESTGKIVSSLMQLTLFVMAPFFGLLAGEAEWIVKVLLGPEWSESALMLTLLAPAMMLFTGTSWLDRLFDVFMRQRAALFLQITYIAVVSLSVSLTLVFLDATIAVGAFALISAAYFVIFSRTALVPLDLLKGSGRTIVVACFLFVIVFLLSLAAKELVGPWGRASIYCVTLCIASTVIYLRHGKFVMSRLRSAI
jgi:O-antigen/teichoic acid export membrane protein